MKENNLKIAQQDIEDALKAIEDIEKVIDSNSLEKEMLKAKFVTLTEKVQKVEEILKSEGILQKKVRKTYSEVFVANTLQVASTYILQTLDY